MAAERVPSIASGQEFTARYGGAPETAAEVDRLLAESRGSAPGVGLRPDIFEQMAHNPGLAARLGRLNDYLAHTGWTEKPALRELVLQVANRELGSTYLHLARLEAGFASGLSAVKLASLDFVRPELFDEEEIFTIEFTRSVLRCSVSDAQFAQATERFGERGALQLIVTISAWRWLSMVANVLAGRPRRVGVTHGATAPQGTA